MRPLPRRPFRFSSPVGNATDLVSLVERARMLEDLGYATATISDHFGDQLAPVPALAAVATATTDLRLAPLVLCNDFRHPVVVAKEAATLDVLSGGRLEFGLGAGWMETDYTQSGIALDPPQTRVERMGEAIRAIKALWGEQPVHLDGEHYRITDLRGTPTPIQRPGPPVIIGGGGRRVLEMAAREADIVGFNPKLNAGRIDASAGPSATPDATDRKLGWVHDAAGSRWEHLELQVRLEAAIVVDDPDPLFEALSAGFGLSPSDARQSPHALAGPVPAMVEALQQRRERWGFSYIGVPYDAAEAFAPVVAALAGT